MKKVLIVSPTPTHPTIGGNRSCILSYCEMLRREGYQVSYLWIVNFDTSSSDVRLMNEYWGDQLFLFRKGFFHRIKESLLRHLFFKRTGYYNVDDHYPFGIGFLVSKLRKQKEFDSVIVNYVFLSKIFKLFPKEKKVLFTHDAFTNKFQFTNSRWFSLTPNDEQKGLNRADIVLSIQERESIFYSFLTKRPVLTSFTYFDIQESSFIGNKNILYLGGANSYNIDSLIWYIENVHRKLVEIDPDIKLLIGGAICKFLGNFKGEKGLSLLGFVENKSAFYNLGDVSINPTCQGTGLKIKTFEALANGKVLVAHSHSLEGMHRGYEKPFLIADSAEEFINSIILFLNDEELVVKQKAKALEYVRFMNTETLRVFNIALA